MHVGMSPLAHTPLDDIRRQLDVNVVGQVAVTQARARPRARRGPCSALSLRCCCGGCDRKWAWMHAACSTSVSAPTLATMPACLASSLSMLSWSLASCCQFRAHTLHALLPLHKNG